MPLVTLQTGWSEELNEASYASQDFVKYYHWFFSLHCRCESNLTTAPTVKQNIITCMQRLTPLLLSGRDFLSPAMLMNPKEEEENSSPGSRSPFNAAKEEEVTNEGRVV